MACLKITVGCREKILCKNKTNAYIKSCIQYKEIKKQTNKQNNIKKLNKNKTKQSSKKDDGLIGWKRLAEVYLTWTAIFFIHTDNSFFKIYC